MNFCVMGVEDIDYTQIGRSIYQKSRDGDLTGDERTELLSSYEAEKCEITEETCSHLQSFKDAMDIFEDATKIPESIKKLQMIIGVPRGNERDGVFGPGSFQMFTDYKNETNFSGGLEELLQKYEEFRQVFLSSEDKRSLQPIGGKDGEYGQGTFKHMLTQAISAEIAPEEQTERVQEEQIGTGDQHPETIETAVTPDSVIAETVSEEQTETTEAVQSGLGRGSEESEKLSDNEKVEKFIFEASSIPKVLIEFLQAGISAGVNGNFGADSARAAIIKYPEAQSLEEIMTLEGIPMSGDDLLPGGGGIESRDIFRERYGAYISILENNLALPAGLIESISRQESQYGAIDFEDDDKTGNENLISWSGCKGIMQLSSISMEDMKMEHRGGEIYRELFQSLDVDGLLSSIIVDGETAGETIPQAIITNLRDLSNPETSDSDYDSAVEQIGIFLKEDNTYFNHAMNIIMGSVYLSGAYHDNSRGDNDIGMTAYHYNGDKDLVGDGIYKEYYNSTGDRPEHREHYANLVRGFHDEILSESTLVEGIGEEEALQEEVVDSRNENMHEYSPQLVQGSMSWIRDNVTNFDMLRLQAYFEVEADDIKGLSVAVLDFQTENGLDPIDGKPGEDTLGRIDEIERRERVNTSEITGVDINELLSDRDWGEHIRYLMDSVEGLMGKPLAQISDIQSGKSLMIRFGKAEEINSITAPNTPRGVIRYARSMNIASGPAVDASNVGNSATVRGAAFDFGDSKHVHGVETGRRQTIGCVGLQDDYIYNLALYMEQFASAGPYAIPNNRSGKENRNGFSTEPGTCKKLSIPPMPVYTV